MTKVYQPIVIEEAEELIKGLEDAEFFKDYEIEDLTFARIHVMNILTEKFISGDLDGDIDELFTEDEFDQLLKELVAGSILYELKDKGYVNSYQDEDTEEMFFLTEEGKKYIKEDKTQSRSNNILKDLDDSL
jgi:DNA-binding MarR family transcriptional regulator